MRITFFSLNRLSFAGGAEKYIIEVARALKRDKNEVFYVGDCRPILSLNIFAGFFLGVASLKKSIKELLDLNKYPFVTPETEKSINLIKLRFSALLPFSVERKRIKEHLKTNNLILVKNEILDMIVFCLLGTFKHKPKIALLIFSSLFYPSKTFRGKVHNCLYTGIFYKFLLKKYDFMIVSNKADIDFLSKNFRVESLKIKYIPYGLDPQKFSLKIQPRKEDIFKILFVGRLEEQKGVDFLAEVINGLSKDSVFRKLKFTIIGDGPWRSQITFLAEKFPNVNYLGSLSREKVKEAYLDHDLLVVPSRWETFSYVTLEAQFCGLPVVAFDIPGPQDIVENGRTGILVPLGDISLFVKAIIEYLGKNVTVEERQYIRIRAYKEFSLDETAKKILNL